jgi:hypothetical protein
VGYGLLVVPQNRREDEDGTWHVSRSSGLLHLEVSRARVSQSSLKTSEGAMRMVHVTSSWMSCGDEAKDSWIDETGCIRLFYPNFTVFFVLGHKDSLVISLSYKYDPKG